MAASAADGEANHFCLQAPSGLVTSALPPLDASSSGKGRGLVDLEGEGISCSPEWDGDVVPLLMEIGGEGIRCIRRLKAMATGLAGEPGEDLPETSGGDASSPSSACRCEIFERRMNVISEA